MVTRCDMVSAMVPAERGDWVGYEAYAALKSENERLKEKVGVTMGVGSGGGNSFVHGDYDSIKVLQGKLLEMERLLSENERLKAERVDLEKFREAVEAFRWEQWLRASGAKDAGNPRRREKAQRKFAHADRLLALIDAHKGE